MSFLDLMPKKNSLRYYLSYVGIPIYGTNHRLSISVKETFPYNLNVGIDWMYSGKNEEFEEELQVYLGVNLLFVHVGFSVEHKDEFPY